MNLNFGGDDPSYSACVDANYDIKESVKDIQQTVQ